MNEERETFSTILFWGLVIAAIVLTIGVAYWIGMCCRSCLVMEKIFDRNDKKIWERVKWQRDNNVKSDPQEVIVAENYEKFQRYDRKVFTAYTDIENYTNYTNVKY